MFDADVAVVFCGMAVAVVTAVVAAAAVDAAITAEIDDEEFGCGGAAADMAVNGGGCDK